MTKQTEKQTIRRISWLIWGLLLGLVLLLGSAFSRTWKMHQLLSARVATLEPMLTASADEQVRLQATLEYVQQDTYVEGWARVHAGMTQPGETLVIPIVPTATPTPLPTPIPSPTPTPGPFWQQWWQTLRGS